MRGVNSEPSDWPTSVASSATTKIAPAVEKGFASFIQRRSPSGTSPWEPNRVLSTHPTSNSFDRSPNTRIIATTATTMLVSSSRLITHRAVRRCTLAAPRRMSTASAPKNVSSSAGSSAKASNGMATGAVLATAATLIMVIQDPQNSVTWNAARLPASGDILSMGTLTKESQTGIMFPQLCNAMNLVGVGVRIKYVFVKVYAVGTYMDPVAMMAIKRGSKSDMEKALLDPTYPRTIRIVMNRGLSIDKYTAAIVESIEPRLRGRELETLDEFKKLNPSVDLVEGAEIEMTIRGDTLLYKNAVGGVASLRSRLFCEALCDVYYGSDPVSPDHKASVLEGIPKL